MAELGPAIHILVVWLLPDLIRQFIMWRSHCPPGQEQRMSALARLNWREVRAHYDNRVQVHRELLTLYQADRRDFANLLLGISDPTGNYSADEHNLGPQILAGNGNAVNQVCALAQRFMNLQTAYEVPELIRAAAIRFLKIGVGSEASCMVNPNACWIANTRTIWTHLVIKHADNFSKADEELRLYRGQDDTSEMAYRIWSAIHRELATSMTRIAEEGQSRAIAASVEPGPITYLWADAIANELYANYYE